jgi:hypothetical protein
MDLTEGAGTDDLHHAAVRRAIVVYVVPHLGDALALERGSDHGAAFADGIGQRLLHKHVFAGLAGLDGGESVPVVRRGHHHGVQVFAIEQLAEIVVLAGLVALRLFDGRHGGIEVRPVEIADGRRDHVGLLHELMETRGSLAAQADEADLNLIARRRRGERAGSGERDSAGHQLHESSSGCEFGHQQTD